MTDADKAAIISNGQRGAFWEAWLQPLLAARCKQTLEGLAAGRSDSDDIKRGWFQALRWVLSLPQQELEAIARSESEAAAEHTAAGEDDFRAQAGFRSPYKQVPQPGATKLEEADAN